MIRVRVKDYAIYLELLNMGKLTPTGELEVVQSKGHEDWWITTDLTYTVNKKVCEVITEIDDYASENGYHKTNIPSEKDGGVPFDEKASEELRKIVTDKDFVNGGPGPYNPLKPVDLATYTKVQNSDHYESFPGEKEFRSTKGCFIRFKDGLTIRRSHKLDVVIKPTDNIYAIEEDNHYVLNIADEKIFYPKDSPNIEIVSPTNEVKDNQPLEGEGKTPPEKGWYVKIVPHQGLSEALKHLGCSPAEFKHIGKGGYFYKASDAIIYANKILSDRFIEISAEDVVKLAEQEMEKYKSTKKVDYSEEEIKKVALEIMDDFKRKNPLMGEYISALEKEISILKKSIANNLMDADFMIHDRKMSREEFFKQYPHEIDKLFSMEKAIQPGNSPAPSINDFIESVSELIGHDQNTKLAMMLTYYWMISQKQ